MSISNTNSGGSGLLSHGLGLSNSPITEERKDTSWKGSLGKNYQLTISDPAGSRDFLPANEQKQIARIFVY